MVATLILFFTTLVFSLETKANFIAENSAHRPPNTDASLFIEAYRYSHPKFLGAKSALDSAKPYRPDVDPSPLPNWTASASDFQTSFQTSRDERVYRDPRRQNFPRRSTWLFPYDGCYARAGHIARSFERSGFNRPGQVFAFGNLGMKTKYSRNGAVSWWFHVAPAYRVDRQIWVLDPAVDTRSPLPLSEWVRRISRDSTQVRVSLCDSNAYIPASPCLGGRKINDAGSVRHTIDLLPREWNQLLNLRLQPGSLLGDSPPW